MKRGALAAGLLLLVASAGQAANSIDVTTAAAMGGTVYGVEFTADGSANEAYLLSRHPRSEPSYSLDFLFHPNTLSTNAEPWVMLKTWRNAPFEPVFEILVRQKGTSGRFRITLFVFEDNGARRKVGRYIVKRGDTPATIGVKWLAASAPGANDGMALLLRDGLVTNQLSDVDSDSMKIDALRVGFVHGAAYGAVQGSFYFDEFHSYK